MDTAQWPQGIGLVKPMEDLAPCSTNTTTASTTCSTTRPQLVERKPRPQREQALNCPRCNSTNTKFCYYNNYSLTQPRYFCKTCRRYWTEGGSLRNVPVGGGSRKNKRSYTSSSTTTSSSTNTTPASSVSTSMKLPSDLMPPHPIPLQNPTSHEGHDLNLSFPSHSLPHFGDFPSIDSSNGGVNISKPSNAFSALSAMELLRSKISGRGLGPFMAFPMAIPEASAVCPSGFGLQELKPSPPSLNLDGIRGDGEGGGSGYGTMQAVQAGGTLLFPFENLRQVSSGTSGEFEHNRGQGGDPPGFWNGMMGNDGRSW